MLFDDAGELDTDTDYQGEEPPEPDERDNEDPAPNAP